MFVKLPFEVKTKNKDGSPVTFSAGSVVNVGKWPEIAKMLEKYKKRQANASPQDKMVRTSNINKKDVDGERSGYNE